MPTHGPCLVAIVDDEESVRRALGRLLRAAGMDVETYSCGSDFLLALRHRRPQCVVLDLRMPGLGGLELQTALVEAGENIPVVIVTSDDATQSRDRAIDQGAKAYLRKPVNDDTLLDAIQVAVRSAKRPVS